MSILALTYLLLRFVHCSSSVRLLFVFCSSSVRLLFVFCSSFVRLLFVFCSSFVRLLFVVCSSFVRLLFVFCSLFVRCLFVVCSSFLYLLVRLALCLVACRTTTSYHYRFSIIGIIGIFDIITFFSLLYSKSLSIGIVLPIYLLQE